jgi:hypothetical protein
MMWCCRLLCAMMMLTLAAMPANAAAPMSMADMSHGRYLGEPDFALTSALIAAGGGPHAFHAERLSAMLAAQHRDAEISALEARFGRARTQRYFATFDAFVDDAIAFTQVHHVALPRPDPALAHDPYELAASLRAAGVMPDGRFDIGYFIEHLLSRPLHKTLMDSANADPAIGPAVNADFHVILTAEMDDLKTLYHLPQ